MKSEICEIKCLLKILMEIVYTKNLKGYTENVLRENGKMERRKNYLAIFNVIENGKELTNEQR